MGYLAIEGGIPVREKMLPYGQQSIDEEDLQCVVDVLRSDFITQGPQIPAFEEAIAAHVGAKYAVAFSSGTAALHGACYAAGIGPGDEVITTAITFVASSNCVLYQGGRPVFADIFDDTYNIDPEKLECRITSKTKAIIAVDFTGQPVEMDRIHAIAEEHNLVVIQDAAHSLGAEWKSQKVGTLSDMTMFSFHPVKHITTAEGGIIVTDNIEYYARLQLFRSHGITKDAELLGRNDGPWYHEMQDLGYHYRMTEIQAVLGLSQLQKLDRFVARRREIADLYNNRLGDLQGIRIPFQHPNTLSSWHLYILRFDLSRFKMDRKQLFEALRAENIGVNVHYIPVYMQPYYQSLGYSQGLCPIAEQFYEEAITIPLFPKMTNSDAEDVICALKKVHKAYFID
jgi:perosamine synthetase